MMARARNIAPPSWKGWSIERRSGHSDGYECLRGNQRKIDTTPDLQSCALGNSSVARLLRKARSLERSARGRKGFQHEIQQDERAAEAQRRTGEEAAGHAGPTGPEASRRGARPQPGSNPPRGRPASEEGRGRRARGRRLSGFMEGAKLRLGGLTLSLIHISEP